eukprot:GDKI01015714.1.p1 GENE.GDKI01015714.1~~GDKI01015714.1.p1  ORF type:complete len:655 (-),score=237.83 GDKI01015714.1:19-1983(-)
MGNFTPSTPLPPLGLSQSESNPSTTTTNRAWWTLTAVSLSVPLVGALALLASRKSTATQTGDGNKSVREPPYVCGWIPWLGVALEYGKDAGGYLYMYQKKMGDVFTLKIAGQRMTFILDPRNFSTVFKTRTLHFTPIANEISQKAFDLGHSAVTDKTLHEELHRTFLQHISGSNGLRPLTQRFGQKVFEFVRAHTHLPTLSPTNTGALARLSVSATSQSELASQSETPTTGGQFEWHDVSLWRLTNECIFFAGTDALFGDGFYHRDGGSGGASDMQTSSGSGSGRSETAKNSQGGVGAGTTSALGGSGGSELLREFHKFDSQFHLLVAGVPAFLLGVSGVRRTLANRFRAEALHGQMDKNLSGLIKAREECMKKHGLDAHNQTHYELTLLWAAMGNTVPAAFWALACVVAHKDVWERVRGEIMRAVEETPEETDKERPRFHPETLGRMPLLDACINESLRFSSVSMMIRVASEDTTLAVKKTVDGGKTVQENIHVRKGDRVCMFPQLLHMDPDVFTHPHTYTPDRFMSPDGTRRTAFQKNGSDLPFALMPFGGGVSMCPGRYFAMNEIRLFVAVFVHYFDLQLKENAVSESTVGALPVSPSPLLPPIDFSRAGLGVMPPKHDVVVQMRARAGVCGVCEGGVVREQKMARDMRAN